MTAIAKRAATIANSQDIEFVYDESSNETKIRVNGNLVSLNDYYFYHNGSSVGSEAVTANPLKEDIQSALTDVDIINISGKILGNL